MRSDVLFVENLSRTLLTDPNYGFRSKSRKVRVRGTVFRATNPSPFTFKTAFLLEKDEMLRAACKRCGGSGGHALECGCSYEYARCLGTGVEPPEHELAERFRLAAEDAALRAAGIDPEASAG